MEGVEGVITGIDYKSKICIVNFTIGLGHYEFSRLKKVVKKEENILERGKEVLNSQNEKIEFKPDMLGQVGYVSDKEFEEIINGYKEKVNKVRAEFNHRLDEIFSA